jgi:RNA polymerase sigma-70 factor, ECF subfamily
MPDQHSQSGERLEREQALAALMRAANEGDKNAYRLFLEKVMPFVRGLTRRHRAASGSSDGEDIVQEVLLALHLKRHTWQPDQAISPWIAAITRHKIIDEFRKTKRRMELPFDENFDAPNPEPEQDMLSNREMERLMSQVSDSQRAVVTSITMEGRSITQTASHFGMSEGAVRVALHRGLKALAAAYRSFE